MTDPVERSNQLVAAYNAKDFAKLTALFHPELDFEHVNRGYVFKKRDELMAVLQQFATALMPDRKMGAPQRVLAQGDTVVRVATWGGTAQADMPGFAKAGEKVNVTLCSIMRFDAQGRLVEWKDFG